MAAFGFFVLGLCHSSQCSLFQWRPSSKLQKSTWHICSQKKTKCLIFRKAAGLAVVFIAANSSPSVFVPSEKDSEKQERTLTLFSPSKVNLFLRIIRRREDGFHDLASLFQTISLGDTIQFKETAGAGADELTCNNASVPLDPSNLILRAVSLFKEHTGYTPRISAHLTKVVPVEAGLGGGSANAATALWAMNELSGAALPSQTLVDLGAALGSDVPFFLSNGSAYCTSRGEVLHEVGCVPLASSPSPVFIVKPDPGLSTARIFKALDLSNLSPADPDQLLSRFVAGTQTPDDYLNDLETASFAALPLLHDLKRRLQQLFAVVLMSGSGTSFFCLEPRAPALLQDDIKSALHGFPVGVRTYSAHFINRPADAWYQGAPGTAG